MDEMCAAPGLTYMIIRVMNWKRKQGSMSQMEFDVKKVRRE